MVGAPQLLNNLLTSAAPVRDVSKTQDFDEVEVEDLKVQILAAVASLDRGLAANVSACRLWGATEAIRIAALSNHTARIGSTENLQPSQLTTNACLFTHDAVMSGGYQQQAAAGQQTVCAPLYS